MLERDGPMPLYYQIANILRSRIASGEWAPGDRLPSEAQLAASFQVSPVTMRQALGVLERQGRLDRRQGVGTFVRPGAVQEDRVRITIPLEMFAEPIAGFEVRTLSLDHALPPPDVRETLGLAPGEQCVHVRRVRSAAHGPVTYASSYMPRWIGDGLTLADLQHSLMTDILEKQGVRVSGAIQTIEASLANQDSAGVLGVPVGAAVLLVRRVYQLENGQVGLVAVNHHPGHEIRFELRLTRDSDAGRWDLHTQQNDT
ncbi:GntR family transcriptional regulator [Phytohabitans kaempferiae]|uniref:GntR family transcriptional regulator n=1 Tax=Phytohabitans kaempferiae TaxID=1620943 RepID=A0ABV6LZK5_9ACTN